MVHWCSTELACGKHESTHCEYFCETRHYLSGTIEKENGWNRITKGFYKSVACNDPEGMPSITRKKFLYG